MAPIAAIAPLGTASTSLHLQSYDPSLPQTSNLPADTESTSSSHTSSPESRPIDLRSPILEEEEDETASETATNEPLTPTDTHHTTQNFQDKMGGPVLKHDPSHVFAPVHAQPTPLILNTAASPPPPAGNNERTLCAEEQKGPKTPIQKRPTASTTQSQRGPGIKRAVSGFFRRSNSHSAHLNSLPPMTPLTQSDGQAMTSVNGPDPMLGKEHRRMSVRRMSATNSAHTTRSNTPPSPGSPADVQNTQAHIRVEEPSEEAFFANSRKNNRSSTGFGLRNTFSRHKIAFATHPQATKTEKDEGLSRRHRATSVDLDSLSQDPNDPGAQLPPRQIWGMAADTGTGLKARRMSLSLPDDFLVDVVELYLEYSDQSKLVGRRGKSIGKGATANVRLMNRKGCPGELYAVKEFRGKSTTEKEADYEQKVKSEYSIAKSVRHPNVVETFRLCTHNGRWNHVMEFCDQGDLFSLVSQKYLARDDHLVDRLCLFKQLVQGLNYLHNNGIAHRDVKLENLLVTKDSKLKITDFGVSEVFAGIHPGLRSAGGQCGKEMGEIRLCAPGMCGSPPYVAPEVIAKKGEYDPRPLDVWGAAIVMLCLCANGVLWQEAKAGSSPLYDDLIRGWTKWNTKHAEADAGITESDYPHVSFFDQHINPPALRRVLLTMLNPDPSKRASMASVAKNRWLKNVECCQIDSYDDPATIIDASRSRTCLKGMTRVVHHNHLPPQKHLGHSLVRLPGSTHM